MVRGGCAIIGGRCRIDKYLGDDQHDLGDHCLKKRLVRGGCAITGLRRGIDKDLGDDQDDLGDHGLKKRVGQRRMRYNWVEV